MCRILATLRWTLLSALLGAAVLVPSACNFDPRASSDGLKPGMNYMQPLKWRMTYYYRVQKIKPNRKTLEKRDAAMFPGTPAVGQGTYEVWLVGPRAGEEIRNVKMTGMDPKPTKITKGKDTDVEFVYYDFAPDGYLPQEITAQVTWEFITMEPYTLWEGLPKETYDKTSDLYKTYTKMEAPISNHPMMAKKAKSCIPEDHPDDYMHTALNCYNYITQNFTYDLSQLDALTYAGLQGMTDSYRAWENMHGVCDETTNVYCSMLRAAGIPARPVAGIVHATQDHQMMLGGGHAWAEFYLPGAGWVPVDPTWGVKSDIIEPEMSLMGSRRQIPYVDYYFGKHDPYRIVLFKDWNYTLQPPPKTKNCRKAQDFMVCYTDRSSGVRDVVYGWEGTPGRADWSSAGWARSQSSAGYNFRPEIELVGPPSKEEIKDLIEQIKKEGANFVREPVVPLQMPVLTTGKVI